MSWDSATAVPRGFTIEDVNALAAGPSPLSAVAARASAVAMYNGRPLVGEAVTDDFLTVIGARMLLGRPLLRRMQRLLVRAPSWCCRMRLGGHTLRRIQGLLDARSC